MKGLKKFILLFVLCVGTAFGGGVYPFYPVPGVPEDGSKIMSQTSCNIAMAQPVFREFFTKLGFSKAPEDGREFLAGLNKIYSAEGVQGFDRVCNSFEILQKSLGSEYSACVSVPTLVEMGLSSLNAVVYVSAATQFEFQCGPARKVIEESFQCIMSVSEKEASALSLCTAKLDSELLKDPQHACDHAKEFTRCYAAPYSKNCGNPAGWTICAAVAKSWEVTMPSCKTSCTMNADGSGPVEGGAVITEMKPEKEKPQLRMILQAKKAPVGPLQVRPEQLPVDFKPQQLPVDLKPQQLPVDLKPQQLPVDFKPQQLPVDLKPQQLPVDLKPQQLPVDLKPQQLPVDFKPQQLPVDLLRVGKVKVIGPHYQPLIKLPLALMKEVPEVAPKATCDATKFKSCLNAYAKGIGMGSFTTIGAFLQYLGTYVTTKEHFANLCKQGHTLANCVGSSYQSCYAPSFLASLGLSPPDIMEVETVKNQLDYECGAGYDVFYKNFMCYQTVAKQHAEALANCVKTFTTSVQKDPSLICKYAQTFTDCETRIYAEGCPKDADQAFCKVFTIGLGTTLPQCALKCP